MADLNPLDEKLGEVLGLAQAAQEATKAIGKMEDAEDYAGELERMSTESAEVERKLEALIDGIDGKKTAIREKGRETKAEGVDMMKTYLGDEEEALDGFEFLSMTEAGELCHWEIVEKIAGQVGEREIAALATEVVATQRRHVDTVRDAYLGLAGHEAEEMAA